MSWSKSFENCQSCYSTLFRHKAKGYCTRCYSIWLKVNGIVNLNAKEIDKIKYKYLTIHDLNIKDVDILREKIIAALEHKLKWLKIYGRIQSKKDNLDLLKLELIFNAVARRAGKGESFYTQDLTYFQTRFNQEQVNILGLKLLKILI